MKGERFCLNCNGPLSYDQNGNAKYCSNYCYNLAKNTRGSEIYRKHATERQIMLNDEILHEMYLLYGWNQYIPVNLFANKGFNWNFHEGLCYIYVNIPAKMLKRYCYSLFINQTILICKL